MQTFSTVLVANRGEIAVRVIRTLRAMGIRSVAVYSDADATARHVADADVAVRLGPAPARESYLSIERVLAACLATGAQAVHPGYGFLSENAAFATALDEQGIAFLGPPAHAILTMGDKITAKKTVSASGVPVVPGIAEPGLTDAELIAASDGIGYPILVKPSAGGGGKGMRVVERAAELAPALASARREAASSFGDDTLFLERLVLRPRHIEVQVLADQHGTVIHLGERECSLQRRHQKVVEEAPSPLLDPATRARIGAAACATARSVQYTGAGTVEFIVSADQPDEFFFMEMNTRLQVEHPVTEEVTGIDLVEWQLRVAAGERLAITQDDVQLNGHAIEARIYAEDPGRSFLPTGGQVLGLLEPHGPGIRVDSGLSAGTTVGSSYDPMLAKVIAHGADRREALQRLDQALAASAVLGVQTNTAFVRHLLAQDDVQAGRLDTGLLDQVAAQYVVAGAPDEVFLTAAADAWLRDWEQASTLWDVPDGWRLGERAPSRFRFSQAGRTVAVTLTGSPSSAHATVDERPYQLTCSRSGPDLALTIDGRRETHRVARDGTVSWVHSAGTTYPVARAQRERLKPQAPATGSAELLSPMPGSIIAVHTEHGASVERGTPIVVVEAMKMEHQLIAPFEGTVELLVKTGEQVALDQPLARIVAPAETPPDKGDPT